MSLSGPFQGPFQMPFQVPFQVPFQRQSHGRRANSWGLRTIILGAGSAGATLARDLRRNPDYGLQPVAFLDDDVTKRHVAGLPVLGRLCNLAGVAQLTNARAAIVAIPSAPAAQARALADAAAELGLLVRYLPSFLSAVERAARAADMRTLSVHALLGRPELNVVRGGARRVIENRRVLVTGAGGSIGSELCRQVYGYGPASLFMLDHDESNLHRSQLEITGQGLLDTDEIVIADIRDRDRIEQLFQRLRPHVVLHAAAHKHLPLLERYPCEGVKTNVAGTRNLIDASLAAGVERFVLISTDKAADPTSVLGATKRLAEILVTENAMGTARFGSVRFGNVLGSRGSLLSVLADQIERGGPVTITDPDVTRFFMTVEEAVGLVLEAAAMAEFGETFVLDMGEPVRIVDLVRRYAEQLHISGVDIQFTGLRAGEKLHETVFSVAEERIATANPKIWATRPRRAEAGFGADIEALYAAADDNAEGLTRSLLQQLVREYTPRCDDAAPAAYQAPYPDGY